MRAHFDLFSDGFVALIMVLKLFAVNSAGIGLVEPHRTRFSGPEHDDVYKPEPQRRIPEQRESQQKILCREVARFDSAAAGNGSGSTLILSNGDIGT